MAEITTELIKELRDKTGISVMECKKALEEAAGDMEKALEVLKEKSAKAAAKKGDRELGAGVVASYVHNTSTAGAMVELACETDFVSANEEFKKLANEIALHIVAMSPKYLTATEAAEKGGEAEEALFEQPFLFDPSVTVGIRLDQAVQKFGERTTVVRFTHFVVGA
jgi:elongation factor Ts